MPLTSATLCSTQARADGGRLPWWASPLGINIGFLFPVFLLIVVVGNTGYLGLTIRGIRYLDGGNVFLGIALLAVTGLAGWIGAQVASRRPAVVDTYAGWDKAAIAVGSVALCAYLDLFRDFFFSPMLLVKTLMGSYRPDRTNIELVPGLTSLVNVAPVFFSIYFYKNLVLAAPMARPINLMCAALLGFTAFRVYAWSERLALIEVAAPFALACAIWSTRTSNRKLIGALRLGPFAAIPVLIAYFALTESVRSWASPTYNHRVSFWHFAIGRFASYYYTSLNNGAGLLATGQWPSFKFEYTLLWLHKAPLVGQIFSTYVDLQYSQIGVFLRKFGDPEFNNPSGNFSVLYDLGVPVGISYFIAIGFVAGMSYRAYRSASYVGVLFYPMLFVTFLEVFRYPYLGAPRAFTWFVGIVLALSANRFSLMWQGRQSHASLAKCA